MLQLGPRPVLQNLIYRAGLGIGYWQWKTPPPPIYQTGLPRLPLPLPSSEAIRKISGFDQAETLSKADEIINGQVRLFGGTSVPLKLNLETTLLHWTHYENGRNRAPEDDLKLIWEPARFGWALVLMQANGLTGDVRWARYFWARLREFQNANPPFLGPNWMSGQEAAIRLITTTWAGLAMPEDTSTGETFDLGRLIASHAFRIDKTLIYAQSQRNNHLVLEAAGLFTAGSLLPSYPQAKKWLSKGWRLFHQAIQDQIEPDGTYIQHSVNYHRLMLQVALWVFTLARAQRMQFPPKSQKKLAQATNWLSQRVNPNNGWTPNLGHNDGALLFPIPTSNPLDYRPTVQAASRAFNNRVVYPPGSWDSLALWLDLPGSIDQPVGGKRTQAVENTIEIQRYALAGKKTTAYLRAVPYHYRPGQCDQLQVDIWVGDQPITLDAGTFQYSGLPPWDNSLAGTAAHNTIQIGGKDQMLKAGRFLWLDWAQGKIRSEGNKLIASHDGYRNLGVIHERTLSLSGADNWQVLDRLIPNANRGTHQSAILHWLLPDLPWKIQGTTLQLDTSLGRAAVQISLSEGSTGRTTVQVVRCGKILAGPGSAPAFLGWFSPTYHVLKPALSFRFIFEGALPLSILTTWNMPG